MAGAVEPVARTTVAQTDNITMDVAPASHILCPHCHTYLPMGRSSISIFSSQNLPLHIIALSLESSAPGGIYYTYTDYCASTTWYGSCQTGYTYYGGGGGGIGFLIEFKYFLNRYILS